MIFQNERQKYKKEHGFNGFSRKRMKKRHGTLDCSKVPCHIATRFAPFDDGSLAHCDLFDMQRAVCCLYPQQIDAFRQMAHVDFVGVLLGLHLLA